MTLQQRTPLRPRREKERRKKHPMPMPGAMNDGRVKEKRVRPMNAAEKRHADRVAAMGCLVCKRPAQIHHETKVTGLRDHRYLTPLCVDHHTAGPDARHTIKVQGFLRKFGINLITWALEAWQDSQRIEAKRKAEQ